MLVNAFVIILLLSIAKLIFFLRYNALFLEKMKKYALLESEESFWKRNKKHLYMPIRWFRHIF